MSFLVSLLILTNFFLWGELTLKITVVSHFCTMKYIVLCIYISEQKKNIHIMEDMEVSKEKNNIIQKAYFKNEDEIPSKNKIAIPSCCFF